VLFTSASCATLFQGTSEEIALASDPSGVAVAVNDGHSGTTPYSLRENREQDLQIHFSKPGYQSQDISDASHVQWGYVVSDLFFCGLIGLAVDGLDGAMFAHSQQMVSAHLEPLQSADSAGRGAAASVSTTTFPGSAEGDSSVDAVAYCSYHPDRPECYRAASQ
jgi:hypothetical protein